MEPIRVDSLVIQLTTLIINAIVAITVAYLTYKTANLSRDVTQVKKQTDGITDALVLSEKTLSLALGRAEGRAEARSDAGLSPLSIGIGKAIREEFEARRADLHKSNVSL